MGAAAIQRESRKQVAPPEGGSAAPTGLRIFQGGAPGSDASFPNTAAVATPLTHRAAGMEIPIPLNRATKYGIGGKAKSRFLTSNAGMVQGILSAGLDAGWIAPGHVEQMLSCGAGDADQADLCVEMVNSALDHVALAIERLSTGLMAKLGVADIEFDFPGWEHQLAPLLDEDISEEMEPLDIPSGSARLYAERGSLSVLAFSVDHLPEAYRHQAIQLIIWCARISHHGLSPHMLIDDFSRWQCLGEIAELDNLDEIIAQIDTLTPEQLEARLIAECSELIPEGEERDFNAVHEFMRGAHAAAPILALDANRVSEAAARDFAESLTDGNAPQWLQLAASALAELTDWQAYNVSPDFFGDLCYEFLAPVGFGLPGEEQVFEATHFMSMYAEESKGFTLPFAEDSLGVVANMALGEMLLRYLIPHINPDFA